MRVLSRSCCKIQRRQSAAAPPRLTWPWASGRPMLPSCWYTRMPLCASSGSGPSVKGCGRCSTRTTLGAPHPTCKTSPRSSATQMRRSQSAPPRSSAASHHRRTPRLWPCFKTIAPASVHGLHRCSVTPMPSCTQRSWQEHSMMLMLRCARTLQRHWATLALHLLRMSRGLQSSCRTKRTTSATGPLGPWARLAVPRRPTPRC
mmetsp:Transcript_37682/g.104926  ORF Transcript_37682/g.104926 Transcript_37682/m.104926 type:complete len:203 (+) Transcript_37682:600-1208(+)